LLKLGNLLSLQKHAVDAKFYRFNLASTPQLVGARHAQTGRFWIEVINTEIFFVTLDKSEKAFSPSTRYEGFALSRTRFHWQSQSTTGKNSLTGQRYVRQRENGARFFLFVRPKRADPFLLLGPLRYVSH
jgi:hypothetical protein